MCVRKRPIFKKEEQGGEIDSISCANPQIKVHEPKYKVDGITKYVENHTFTFDNTFNEHEVRRPPRRRPQRCTRARSSRCCRSW